MTKGKLVKISRMIGAAAVSLVLALPLSGVAYAESDGDPGAVAGGSDVGALIVELVEGALASLM